MATFVTERDSFADMRDSKFLQCSHTHAHNPTHRWKEEEEFKAPPAEEGRAADEGDDDHHHQHLNDANATIESPPAPYPNAAE